MVLHVLSMYYIQYYNPQQVGNKMPLKAELDAVQKNYVKLMKLPVKDLLPALKMVPIYVCVCVHSMHGCMDVFKAVGNSMVGTALDISFFNQS